MKEEGPELNWKDLEQREDMSRKKENLRKGKTEHNLGEIWRVVGKNIRF